MKLESLTKEDKKDTFEKLSAEYLDALFGTALRLTRNQQDAEDLVQDVYLKAYKYFFRFETGTNFKAWIFKILMNTFINSYHKNSRQPQSVEFEKVEYAVEKTLNDFETKSILTDENKFRDLFDDEIVTAIENMPYDYRVCVLLCDVENFTYEEIGTILNIPIGTVMSRIFRGRKILQKFLLDYAVREGYVNNEKYASCSTC